MSHLQRVQSFESLLKKTKGFNSLSHFSRQDHVQKNGFNFYESCYKKGFNSSSHIEKNLWDILKRSSVLCIVFLGKAQFFESFFFLTKTQKFNSLSHIQKKNNSLSHAQEISILWVIFWKKKIRSSSHTQKIQLFELHSKKVQFFESFFFFWKEFKFLIFFWVRFFESYSKKGSILWVIFPDRINHFCESKFL